MTENEKNPSVAEVRKKNILDNNLLVMLLALLLGFLSWLFFSMYVDQNGSKVIYDAVINYTNNSTGYLSMGLDIVDKTEGENVKVLVEGNNTIVGNITAADITVYPDYSTVSGAGETSLRLLAKLNNSAYNSSNIKLTVQRPETVTVVFDEVSEKTIPVFVDTADVTISDGFILNRTTSVPNEVTLRGPTSELEQVSSVAAPVQVTKSLSDNTTLPANLELRDGDGNTLNLDYVTMDTDTANVTLTVYQVKELPLVVDFINTPTGFDTSSLHYTLSQNTLKVAGPAKTLSNLETLSVTSFDLAEEFAFGRDYQRQIQLPTGLVSQDGISTVTISFDTENMASKTLNISNIKAINVPSNYNLTILSSLVNGVTLYGPADEIEKLSSNSVVAQIDCQSISMSLGQQTVPVTIQIPSSTDIFATGSYTVQCQITNN